MRFSLNLVELYNEMANEYDEKLEEYMSYREFVEYAKKHGFKVVEGRYGDYIVLDVAEISDEEE